MSNERELSTTKSEKIPRQKGYATMKSSYIAKSLSAKTRFSSTLNWQTEIILASLKVFKLTLSK